MAAPDRSPDPDLGPGGEAELARITTELRAVYWRCAAAGDVPARLRALDLIARISALRARRRTPGPAPTLAEIRPCA